MFLKLMGALLTVIAVGAFFVCLWIEYGPRRDDDGQEAKQTVLNKEEDNEIQEGR